MERKIAWYRSPVDREALAALNQRSDWLGALQTFGYLGILVLTGACAWIAADRRLWLLFALILFLHGTGYAFLLNAFHEFCHKTVFKTRFLNIFFLDLVSFISWNNPVLFWTSHQEHHKYTLHPPDDLEVVLPIKLPLSALLRIALINPLGFYYTIKGYLRLSLGRLEGEWENHLFPPSTGALRRELFTWARLALLGHLLLVAVSLYFKLWQIPVLITLAPFYGGWLQYLCNNTQHVGLQDKVPDFRLCTWTVILNPALSFMYWRMNYHIEHHMYAAVPCYRLKALHRLIEADLPPSLEGLAGAWKKINAILDEQKRNPAYQYVAELPKNG